MGTESEKILKTSVQILKYTQRLTFILVVATVALSIALNLLVNLSTNLKYDFQPEVMWVGLAVCLFILIAAKFVATFKYLYLIFNVFLIFFISMRYLVPGGVQSVLVFGFMGHIIFVYALSGRIWGISVLILNSILYGMLTYLNVPRTYSDEPYHVAILVLLLFLPGLISLYFALEGMNKFLNQMRFMEKEFVSDQILNNLGGKIEQLISEAKSIISQTRSDGNVTRMSQVEKICLEIDDSIKSLESKNSQLPDVLGLLESKFQYYFLQLTTLVNCIFLFFLFLNTINLFVKVGILIICSGLGTLSLYLRKTKNIRMVTKILNTILIVSIPVGIVLSGGVFSPGLLYYLTLITFNFHMLGRKFGIQITIWSLLNIILISFLEIRPEEIDLKVVSIFSPLCMICATVPILFVFDERDKIVEVLREFERKQASAIILKRLVREISNSLQAPLISIGLLRSKGDLKGLEKVVTSLEKIEHVFMALREKMVECKIVDFLNEHESAIEILEKIE